MGPGSIISIIQAGTVSAENTSNSFINAVCFVIDAVVEICNPSSASDLGVAARGPKVLITLPPNPVPPPASLPPPAATSQRNAADTAPCSPRSSESTQPAPRSPWLGWTVGPGCPAPIPLLPCRPGRSTPHRCAGTGGRKRSRPGFACSCRAGGGRWRGRGFGCYGGAHALDGDDEGVGEHRRQRRVGLGQEEEGEADS